MKVSYMDGNRSVIQKKLFFLSGHQVHFINSLVLSNKMQLQIPHRGSTSL